MPKAFSVLEKERIRNHLLKTGRQMINAAGIKKISIDDLVFAVGIAKGSFYSFFPSREDFILSVLETWENDWRKLLFKELEVVEGDPVARWIYFFKKYISLLEDEPGIACLLSTEFDHLIEKLPEERIQRHLENDTAVLDSYMKDWLARGWVHPKSAHNLTPIMMVIFSTALQKKLYKDISLLDYLDFTIKSLSSSLVNGNLEGESHT